MTDDRANLTEDMIITAIHSPQKRHQGTRRIMFRCTNSRCGAVDHWDDFDNMAAPVCLNCWKCHAGKGLKVEMMLDKKIGMFPVKQVLEIHEVPAPGSQPS